MSSQEVRFNANDAERRRNGTIPQLLVVLALETIAQKTNQNAVSCRYRFHPRHPRETNFA